jgi:cyclase
MRAHSRRGFLKQTLGVCWTGATLLEQAVFRAAQARAQSVEAPANLFDIEKVAEGVYAVLARPQAIVNCNAAIFENARDVLIVDTHSKPSAVASLVAQIRKQITSKPIRYVVNTHFHWDHTQGTPTYKRIAPHADVLASTATRRLIADGAGAFKDSLEQTRKSLEGHKARLASAKSGAEKAYYQSVVSQTAAYLEEMSDYTPELPNVTFDRDLVIHDPAHELRLAFRGRGHTSGDVVVYCSQKKVVATGDLLHSALPYIGDGYPREWPLTLYQVAEFGFEHVISGHGPVQHTRERLYQQAAYIEELTDKVANGTRAGHTLAQLQEEIAPSTLFSLRNGGYGEYLMKTLSAAAAPGVTAETVLAAAVRTNVGHVFARLEST